MRKNDRKEKKILHKFFTPFLCSSMITTITLASGTGVAGVDSVIAQITSVLAGLAFLIAIGKVMQIGIMFMFGAGKGKSDAKSAIIPWLVGAFVCALYATIGPTLIGMLRRRRFW